MYKYLQPVELGYAARIARFSDHAMKKPHLPEKLCPVCQRTFSWRKKWERDWPQVKYCSKRCAAQRSLLGLPHD